MISKKKRKNVCTLILVPFFTHFAKIFTDVARIFTKSTVLGVQMHPLHPRILHQCRWRWESLVVEVLLCVGCNTLLRRRCLNIRDLSVFC